MNDTNKTYRVTSSNMVDEWPNERAAEIRRKVIQQRIEHMNQREYRIEEFGNMFRAQVRHKRIFGWDKWRYIGTHTEGFGLYNRRTYGVVSRAFAADIIIQYRKWIANEETGDPIYHEPSA